MPELPTIDDRWIVSRRGPRNPLDSHRPYAWIVEPEFISKGRVEDVGVVFLTNSECPFRCLMCDLWKNTLASPTPFGAVTEQIRWALEQIGPAPHIKLYNAGNFFDRQAIPRVDWTGIAGSLGGRRTVIIESHPKLVDRRCPEFARMIDGRLEVAMGLETVDPVALKRLNKHMTLDDFGRTVQFLDGHEIRVRAFILLRAPFQSEAEGLEWACRSIDWAWEAGVECCVVIPTRSGNGAMDELARLGHFAPPTLESLELAVLHGLRSGRGRVFADLWDAQNPAEDRPDAERIARLATMNRTQQIPPAGGPGTERLETAHRV